MVRRFWWAKVRAIGAMRDWEALEKFSKEKRSPIGYKPFADICISNRAFQEASRYVAKLEQPLQPKYYMRIKCVLLFGVSVLIMV